MHRHERETFERVLAREEPSGAARAAIVEVEDGRPGVATEGDDPLRVVERAAADPDLAFLQGAEVVEILLHARIEHRPFGLEVGARDGLDLVGDRIDERARDVGLGAFEDRLDLAGREVAHRQGRLVPSAAVDHEEPLALAVEPDRARPHGVLEGHGVEGCEVAALDHERGERAVGVHLRDEPHPHRVVEGHVGEARVLEEERPLAGRGVHQMDVVELRIAIVEADRERVGVVAADVGDLRRDAVHGRQVDLGARRKVHRVRPPVLVAAAILQIDQMRRVGHPEVLTDSAIGVLGHRLRSVEVVRRRHPHVEHAIERRNPRELLAVGADLNTGAIGISKQRRAGNERHRVGTARGDRGTAHEEPRGKHGSNVTLNKNG